MAAGDAGRAPMPADAQSLVESFCGITSAAAEEAAFFLESHNWALESAVRSYYDSVDGDAGAGEAGAADSAPPPPPPPPPSPPPAQGVGPPRRTAEGRNGSRSSAKRSTRTQTFAPPAPALSSPSDAPLVLGAAAAEEPLTCPSMSGPAAWRRDGCETERQKGKRLALCLAAVGFFGCSVFSSLPVLVLGSGLLSSLRL